MMIYKVVIPAAGLGTRLLSATKEIPKEMLPIYSTTANGTLCLKPLLQLIFEQLYKFGIREFCFVVGRGKRAIEDHFTPDRGYVADLALRNKKEYTQDLEQFYSMLGDSNLYWVNQPNPLGFGDAILRTKSFAGDEPFLVHAGDTLILSHYNDHIDQLVKAFGHGDCSVLLKHVVNPTSYGVATIEPLTGTNVKVTSVIEKPKNPQSPWAIMPLYIYNSVIFDILQKVKPDASGEVQLTSGIQGIIDYKKTVIGVQMQSKDIRLDIGTPDLYWESLDFSYNKSRKE